MFMQFPVL